MPAWQIGQTGKLWTGLHMLISDLIRSEIFFLALTWGTKLAVLVVWASSHMVSIVQTFNGC